MGEALDIFIAVNYDDVCQVGDKIRFDLTKSFVARPKVTGVDITKIEVSPINDGNYLTIHDSSIPAIKLAVKDWYFDWVYKTQDDASPGHIQEIAFRFTASDSSTETVIKEFSLLTAAQDNLFSTDNDLISHEPDILKWLPDGRSTWNYIHRRCRDRILSYLFEKGYKNSDGTPFDKDQILEKYDAKEWSTFMALKIIFGSITNSKDDVFLQKAKFYETLEGRAATTDIRIDINKDNITGAGESVNMNGPLLIRR